MSANNLLTWYLTVSTLQDLNPDSKSLNPANKTAKQAVAAGAAGGGAAANDADADLEARLDALRRS